MLVKGAPELYFRIYRQNLGVHDGNYLPIATLAHDFDTLVPVFQITND